MLIVEVCVGSSCHLKGSEEIVDRLTAAISQHGLDDNVVLVGSFCSGHCNRRGVTIVVNDEVFTGITPGDFDAFFAEHILARVNEEAQ